MTTSSAHRNSTSCEDGRRISLSTAAVMKATCVPRSLQCSLCTAVSHPRLRFVNRNRHTPWQASQRSTGERLFTTTTRKPAVVADKSSSTGGARNRLASNLRIVPASPSYFSASPDFTDDLLEVEMLRRRYEKLPTIPTLQLPRTYWITFLQYRAQVGEPISSTKYQKILKCLKRMNRIHPTLMPPEVRELLEYYKQQRDPNENRPRPRVIDRHGRATGTGRRKSSSARVWLVEGEGEVLINGKSLTAAFTRPHDRESAVWALKATGRLDKYNVWALVQGGGTTGQAEALTLGVARALLVHEPMLKPALRRGMLFHKKRIVLLNQRGTLRKSP